MQMDSYRSEAAWQRQNNTSTKNPLAAIYYEGSWRLSKVSPLYNLQYKPVKLKQYASKVRQAIVSAVPANSSIKYVVQIKEQVSLKYSEDDASGLTINVLPLTQETNSTSKISYSALLLSWGVSTSLDNATHLPYMLERGEQRIGTAVKATLRTIFDCNIKQFCFTQQELLQFGFSFLEHDSSRGSDRFTLMYKTPQVDHKNETNISLELEDVNIMWNGVQDEFEKKSDLVTIAYKVLQTQIFDSHMLDISMFDLCEIILPKAEVKSTGVIKMKTPEIVNCVFTLLNEICNTVPDKDVSGASGSASDTIS